MYVLGSLGVFLLKITKIQVLSAADLGGGGSDLWSKYFAKSADPDLWSKFSEPPPLGGTETESAALHPHTRPIPTGPPAPPPPHHPSRISPSPHIPLSPITACALFVCMHADIMDCKQYLLCHSPQSGSRWGGGVQHLWEWVRNGLGMG